MKFFYFFFFTLAILAIEASARGAGERNHHHDENHDDDDDHHSHSSSRSCCRPEEYKYKCNHEWANYLLDDAPAEEGVHFGDVSPGVPAFIGYGITGVVVITGRIQLDAPKGFHHPWFEGGERVITDSSKMFYLKNNCHHNYTWEKSVNGDVNPFAVEPFYPSVNGFPIYYGRKTENGKLVLSGVSTGIGALVFNDGNGVIQLTPEYEVLICRSSVYEEPITTTTTAAPANAPSPPTGCVHQWKTYNGDNAPASDGVAAGLYDVDNTAYVGKFLGANDQIFKAARLQTSTPNPGFYGTDRRNSAYSPEGQYLYNNPNYHYYWTDVAGLNYGGATNVVGIKGSDTPMSVTTFIGRLQIDGQTVVNFAFGLGLSYPGSDGVSHFGKNFQVLRCDPFPANPCKQEWKPYKNDDAPASEGLKVDFYKDGIVSYVGRSTNKYVQGKDFVAGRVQTAPANESGVYTLQSVNGGEKFDANFGEYLVKNANDNYSWVNAHTGQEVDNALRIPLSPHNKCCGDEHHHLFAYIGRFYLDNVVHVGTVYQSQGLAFVDVNGDKKVVSSFQVLTCASATKYEESDDSKECLDDEKFYFE